MALSPPQDRSDPPTHEGALVYRIVDGVVRYLVVESKDTPPEWVWPTGHVESVDQAPGDAAVREAEEETGVTAQCVAPLSRKVFQRRRKRAVIDYYLCRFVADGASGESRRTVWLTFGEALAVLRHPESHDLLREAQPEIVAGLAAVREIAADTPAVALLLREHQALSEEIGRNETRGETRVGIHMTLVAAVIAGIVALGDTDTILGANAKLAVAIVALGALLGVGVALYGRLLDRNAKTDRMIADLKDIRARFARRLDPHALLHNWEPYKFGKRRSFVGLTHLVAMLNSFVAGALAFALAVAVPVPVEGAAVGALLAALVSWVVHDENKKLK